MSEFNLSPVETTPMYNSEKGSNSQEMPTETGLIEAFQITSEVNFGDFGEMKESSTDPQFVLAQKRTFSHFRAFQDLQSTADFKMPLVKRAKFYKEQSVKDFMNQTNRKFEKIQEELQTIQERLKEQERTNQAKLKQQERINQNVQEELQVQESINQIIQEKLQATQEKLKEQVRINLKIQEKLQEKNNKICSLEDCFAIHNKRFIFEKQVALNTCETERKVLDLVIEVMAEHEVQSIASDSQSMSGFLNLLRGRLEGLIQVSVDVEARKILGTFGVMDLQQTGYRRVEFAKALSDLLFKSCSQNLSQ